MPTIEVKEGPKNRVPCPYCKQLMGIDLRHFQDDVTKIMESNCPFCKRQLFTAMTILTHKNLHGLMETIQAMSIAVNQVSRANSSRNIIDTAVAETKRVGGS